MNYLDLKEAAELVKSGETVYNKIESDYYDYKHLCFTQEMLVNGIIDYYFNDYKYGHIDSDLHGWVDSITEYVELSEEEYQKWYEEYGEDDDVKHDKMDEYFTYEYVNDYVSSHIMNNYDILHDYELPEEDEDEEDEEEYDEVDETTDEEEECDDLGEYDVVGNIIAAIDGLEVGEERVIRKLNTGQCLKDSFLSDLYKGIIKNNEYFNSKLGTSECEWECYTEELDDDEQTMSEKEKLIIKRIK